MRKLLFSLFLLAVLCQPVYATCDPTLTLCESGCDYSVLNSAVTDLETNCASPTEPLSITGSGSFSSADTTAVTISGISTTATNTLTITMTGDARHDGTTSKSGSYKLSPTGAGYPNGVIALSVNSDYVTIDGLIIQTSSVDNAACTIHVGYPCSRFIFKNNIVYSGGWGLLHLASWADPPQYILNNIFIQPTNNLHNDPAIYISVNDTGSIYLYSNTVYVASNGSTYGIKSNNAATYAKNNIVIGGSTACWNGSFHSSSTHNLSSDASTPEYNTYYDNKTISFVDAANGDLHLSSGETDAIDQGTSTAGESAPLNFTTDIDGTTRSGTWDIGADEYVSSETYSGRGIGRGIMRGVFK